MKTLENTKLLLGMFLAGVFSISTALSQETQPNQDTQPNQETQPNQGSQPIQETQPNQETEIQETQTTTTTTTTAVVDDDNENESTKSGASLELGIRYMPTFSSFELRQPDGSALQADNVVGHGFGALIAVNFSSVVGLQGEVNYSSLAQKYKYQGNEREVNLNYVNIPVLLSLNTGRYRAVNFNVVAGPQFGINVGGETRSMGSTGDAQDSLQTVVAAKAGDIGVAYGAGIDFGLGEEHRTRIGIGFRGVYGLIDISDKSNNQANDDYYILDRTHVETYAAYIGLSFLIK